jgi:hypothetical protein
MRLPRFYFVKARKDGFCCFCVVYIVFARSFEKTTKQSREIKTKIFYDGVLTFLKNGGIFEIADGAGCKVEMPFVLGGNNERYT